MNKQTFKFIITIFSLLFIGSSLCQVYKKRKRKFIESNIHKRKRNSKLNIFQVLPKEIIIEVTKFVLNRDSFIESLGTYSILSFVSKNYKKLLETNPYLKNLKKALYKFIYHAYPLHEACKGGDLWTVKILVSSCRCNINQKIKGYGFETPLCYAVTKKQFSIIKYLVDQGVSVNKKCGIHGPPLLTAVLFNDLETIEFLYRLGADINRGTKYTTPLCSAISMGYYKIASFLIDKGVRVYECARDRRSALRKAAGRGKLKLIKQLVSICEKNKRTEFVNMSDVDMGRTVLHDLTIFRGSNELSELVEILVENGANPNKLDDGPVGFGCTPLHYAVTNQNFGMVQCLLRNGANPHLTNKSGETPLQVAKKRGHKEIELLLLSL